MLNIRVAQPEDARLLSEMGNRSYRYHFSHLWASPAELDAFIAQEYAVEVLTHSLADKASRWIIAVADKPVGFAKYSCHQPVGPTGPTGTLLHKLYLMPEETGKGYGERMVDEVIRLAQAEGDRWLWLEVLAGNPQARRFYQRLGMQHLKDTLFTTTSQQSTLHIMGMELPVAKH